MSNFSYNREHLVTFSNFSAADMTVIHQRRRAYNQLGFAYQLAFTRLLNRFPMQAPLEIHSEIVAFVSAQMGIQEQELQLYQHRQATISEHQELIRQYLNLRLFNKAITETEAFI